MENQAGGFDPVSDETIGRTGSHELGHTASLGHPFSTDAPGNNVPEDIQQGKAPDETVKKNLMNSDRNPNPQNRSLNGKELTPGQLKSVSKTVEKEQPK